MKKYLLISLFAALIAGPWQARADEDQTHYFKRNNFSFVLPGAWSMPKADQPKVKRAMERMSVATKDGVELETIVFCQRPVTAGFDHTKKTLAPGMRPHEMAEIVQGDLELDPNRKNFVVHENKPATVAGMPAFRLVFSYRDEGTLQYQCVYYGFQKGDLFYSIQFIAPRRHYFDAYLVAFEGIVKSIEVNQQKP